MRKKLSLLLCVLLCGTLAACQAAAPAGTDAPSPAATETDAPAQSTPTAEPTQPAVADRPAVLYIGTRAGGFREYPLEHEGELAPEALIQGIGDLTGWDLTLAEPVTDGKGGMSVCLADRSALFQGPPEPQKDEFHMYSAEQLAETILDSIQKTLQNYYVIAPGDPDNLDIWYYREGEKPLELPELGLSWPLEEPYQWASARRG